jgi:hypothetical protein
LDPNGITGVPAGTTGVWLRIRNTGASADKALTRPKGSSEDRSANSTLTNGYRTDLFAKLDGNRTFEGYFQDSALDVRILAYSDQAYFFDTSIDKTAGVTGSYRDTNVGPDGVPGSAHGAILELTSPTAYNFGLRPNGATYDYYKANTSHLALAAVVGVDSTPNPDGPIFEQKIANTNLKLRLWGYFGPDFTPITPIIISYQTAGWVDCDLSAYVPAGAIGALFQVMGGFISLTMNFRKKGASENLYTSCYVASTGQTFTLAGLDAGRICQIYWPSGAGPSPRLVGYFMPASQTISEAGGIDSAEALGSPGISPGASVIAPGGIASPEAFGIAALTPGAVTIQPGGLESGEAWGEPLFVPGPVLISPPGLDSLGAFGVPGVYRIPKEILVQVLASRLRVAGLASRLAAGLNSARLEVSPQVRLLQATQQVRRLEVKTDD